MGGFTSRHTDAIEDAGQSSNQNEYRRRRSNNFFGRNFNVDDDRVPTPELESYLFSEFSNPHLLDDSPVPFAFPPLQVSGPTKPLKSLINIRTKSVRFVRVTQEQQAMDTIVTTAATNNISSSNIESKSQEEPGEQLDSNVLAAAAGGDGAQPPSFYNIEFIFDSDTKCVITIYHFCTEDTSGMMFLAPEGYTSETYHFEKGINQLFSQPGHYLNPEIIPEADRNYNPIKCQYPIAIHCVVDEGPEELRQSVTAFCIIEYNQESNSYALLVGQQKFFIDGKYYLLQDICNDADMLEE